MNLVKVKNEQEYIELIKFLFKKEYFCCIEDWDRFFNLQIFNRRRNETYMAYKKRIAILDKKSEEEIVESCVGKNKHGLPNKDKFPCIILYSLHSHKDEYGKMAMQIFNIFPEKTAKTIDKLLGIKKKNKNKYLLRKSK